MHKDLSLEFHVAFAVHNLRPHCVLEHHVLLHPWHEQRSNAHSTVAPAADLSHGVNHHLERNLNVFSCFPTIGFQRAKGSEPGRATKVPFCCLWEQSVAKLFKEMQGLCPVPLLPESLWPGSSCGSTTHKLCGPYDCECIHLQIVAKCPFVMKTK